MNSIECSINNLYVATKVAGTQSITVMGSVGTFIIIFTFAGIIVDGVACSTVGVSNNYLV